MTQLDQIAERIRQDFDTRTAIRDQTLSQTRTLTRHCSQAIRAIHRNERETCVEELHAAAALVQTLRALKTIHADLYYAGYTQDALKEYAEAQVVYALLIGSDFPDPETLGVEYATYLRGLAEAVGELRRRCLDILRDGYSQQAESLLNSMDEIYALLVTMDYPDAITDGLRRLTDIARSLNERTRGDLTLNLRQQQLEQNLARLEAQLVRFNLHE